MMGSIQLNGGALSDKKTLTSLGINNADFSKRHQSLLVASTANGLLNK